MKKKIIIPIVTLLALVAAAVIYIVIVSQKSIADYGLFVRFNINDSYTLYDPDTNELQDTIKVTMSGKLNRITGKYKGTIAVDGYEVTNNSEAVISDVTRGSNSIYYTAVDYVENSKGELESEFSNYSYLIRFSNHFKNQFITITNMQNEKFTYVTNVTTTEAAYDMLKN